MDKGELIEALRELDRYVSSSFDVVLVGGAAMILHFGADRATHDIDTILLRGERSELRKAVETVAQKRNLPEHWLNEAAKGFVENGIVSEGWWY